MIDEKMPHSAEAERTVLGAILIEPSAVSDAVAALRASDFFDQRNREAFAAMSSLSARGIGVDPVTLKDELKRLNSLADGVYVSSLMDGVPRITNLSPWIEIVKRCAVQRGLYMAALVIQDQAATTETADDAMELAMAEIMRVAEYSNTGGFSSPADALKSTMALIDAMATAKGTFGLPTGLRAVDYKTSGMRPQQLVLIAARPAMGKTAAGLTIADGLAAQGKKVAFFSMEMSREELTIRRVILRSGCHLDAIKYSLAKNGDPEAMKIASKVAASYASLATDPLFIDETPALTIPQLRARARKLAFQQKGLDLIVVDYLQLMRGERFVNRQEEIAGIARGLKNLAKELNVPVLALAQLSREVEKRDDKRPRLSDLRESGELEQAGDVIIFLHHEDRPLDEEGCVDAEWIVAKQRNGSTGPCNVRFAKRLMQFKDAKEAL